MARSIQRVDTNRGGRHEQYQAPGARAIFNIYKFDMAFSVLTLAVAGLASSPGEASNSLCPAGAAACASDSGCHAFGVYEGSFQLHGCADTSALVPNDDWAIFVGIPPPRTPRIFPFPHALISLEWIMHCHAS